VFMRDSLIEKIKVALYDLSGFRQICKQDLRGGKIAAKCYANNTTTSAELEDFEVLLC